MSEQDERVQRLDDYEHGMLDDGDAAAFEEELFERAAAGLDTEAQFAAALHDNASWLAKREQFGESKTRAQIEALLASGRRVHYAELVSDGGTIDIPPWADDIEIVAYKICVDLRGYEQIEVASHRPDGAHIITFRDVAYDPSDGNIYGTCLAPVAKMAFGSGPVTTRISGVRDGKRERIATIDTDQL